MLRGLHTSAPCKTDGVYKDLTNMRVRTPWIDTLRQRREGEQQPSKTPIASASRVWKPKRMTDSFHRVIIPLAQDPWLLDNYLNASGHMRIGTLLMDLDALSGVIAYKHTGESVTTVTAAVDRITIKHPLKELCDLELSGQVTYATGRSSMEISLQVAKVAAKGATVQADDVFMTCAFTMVSLDPATQKPVPIAPLQVSTEEEQRLFASGEKHSQDKKAMAKKALLKQPPNDEESNLIHSMWLKQLEYHDPNVAVRKPENVVYMDSTRLHSSQIMQPQYRNRHNFMIFGGYLLKQTFELAFCCAASVSHSRPTFVGLDPSTFENPVPVGSVLYLTATVAYTDSPLIKTKPTTVIEEQVHSDEGSKCTRVQIRIDSKVRNIEHGETKPTGQFNYTFLVEKDVKVMPRTYSEFMTWADARRRAESVRESSDGALGGSNEELLLRLGSTIHVGKDANFTE